MSNTYSAGVATAYGAAVRGGYTGTYAEWCAAMADFGDKSQQAIVAAEQAAQSATEAANSATDAADSASSAETFKGNAEDSAAAAHNSETNAAASESAAAQSATGAAGSASAAAGSATNAAASAAAAQAVKDSIPADYTELSENVDGLKVVNKLHMDEIDGTTQTIAFDAAGNVSQIVHSANGVAVRTDAFTFGMNTITEVRTLNTGESLTIVTNTNTLVTTVTYAAA